MKYYEVKAKCGHVKRNNYIIKSFYVYAESGKEAAYKTRYIGRVKHHQKDAIISVEEISYEEYELGRLKNKKDMYFNVKNSSDSRLMCAFNEDEIFREEKQVIHKKKKDYSKQKLIEMLQIKEWKEQGRLLYE